MVFVNIPTFFLKKFARLYKLESLASKLTFLFKILSVIRFCYRRVKENGCTIEFSKLIEVY